jgi:hypothetical protein
MGPGCEPGAGDELTAKITVVHTKSRHSYGSTRVHAELRAARRVPRGETYRVNLKEQFHISHLMRTTMTVPSLLTRPAGLAITSRLMMPTRTCPRRCVRRSRRC